jgi:HlyD family secretion protein
MKTIQLNKNRKLFLAGLILIVVAFGVFKFFKKDQPEYITATITKGDIDNEINASGTINPISIVKVSTQVSGIIEKIYVDFNDQVKKGQLIAQLDKSILQSQLDIDTAQLNKTKTALDMAVLTKKRTQSLFDKDYIAKAELDQAVTNAKAAQSDYDAALSQYKKSKRNLSYATILSPVSGVVIAKEVTEGQTVSATTQAPDLFQIAEDLTKMQIEAAVSEADISAIKSGQEVNFTVDAFEDEDFVGKVRQIRLNPTSDQNVVTYDVVIDIDNSNLKLLPGMTAFVNVVIDEKDDVLKVSNSVFNFKMANDKNKHEDKNTATLYVLEKSGNIKSVQVKKGLANEFEAEIISDEIKEGDQVIENEIDGKKSGKSAGKNSSISFGGGGGRR